MVNPMGEDDEDFDINSIIDSNWCVSKNKSKFLRIFRKRNVLVIGRMHALW